MQQTYQICGKLRMQHEGDNGGSKTEQAREKLNFKTGHGFINRVNDQLFPGREDKI